MKQQLNPQNSQLTDEQAIDAIYQMFGEQRQPFEMQPVGQLGIVNPGPKSFQGAILKLGRKVRTLEDQINHTPIEDIIDRDYATHEGELFDLLSDWSRFAIIIPDYAYAPAVVSYFLGEFGGHIDIRQKDDYEAIHQHTTYKNVNLEFQFHTQKYAELKKVTDIFYHKYNNVVLEKNSRIADEYNAQREAMVKYCQTIYQRSNFKQYIPAVQAVAQEYEHRTHGRIENGYKLSHFCMYARKAEMVQNELAENLVRLLERFNQINKTGIAFEKVQG